MTVHSGQKWLGLLTSADRPTSWVRTFLASSRWRSTRRLLIWKASVTPQGRLLFRLSQRMPSTFANESGLWPTANAAKAANDTGLQKSGDGRQTPSKLGWAVATQLLPTPMKADAERGSSTFKRGNPTLRGAVDLMTTPTASDVYARRTKYAQGGTPLSAQVAMMPTPRPCSGDRSSGMNRTEMYQAMKVLPTPTTQDAKNNGSASQMERNSLPLNAEVGGPLNPPFVEWLMGYPIGWTDCEDSATP